MLHTQSAGAVHASGSSSAHSGEHSASQASAAHSAAQHSTARRSAGQHTVVPHQLIQGDVVLSRLCSTYSSTAQQKIAGSRRQAHTHALLSLSRPAQGTVDQPSILWGGGGHTHCRHTQHAHCMTGCLAGHQHAVCSWSCPGRTRTLNSSSTNIFGPILRMPDQRPSPVPLHHP